MRLHPCMTTSYGVPVRQARTLPTQLVCSCASGFFQIPPCDGHPCLRLTIPTAKFVVVFHHLVIAHAGHTRKKTALQCGLFTNGASERNRTVVCSLEGCRSTIELHSQVNGVSEGNRTLDPLIKSQLLYHLSYRDIVVKLAGAARFELTMRESKSLALPLGYAPIGCLAILLLSTSVIFY